jgi:hypothetical protein
MPRFYNLPNNQSKPCHRSEAYHTALKGIDKKNFDEMIIINCGCYISVSVVTVPDISQENIATKSMNSNTANLFHAPMDNYCPFSGSFF